jgi:hypothetical protein
VGVVGGGSDAGPGPSGGGGRGRFVEAAGGGGVAPPGGGGGRGFGGRRRGRGVRLGEAAHGLIVAARGDEGADDAESLGRGARHGGVPGHGCAPAGAERGRVGRVGGVGVWRRAG